MRDPIYLSLKYWKIILILLFTVVILTACGGSSSESEDSNNVITQQNFAPIRVNAGADISLNEQESANIFGGSSGGNGAISYAWEASSDIVIEHPDVSLSNATLIAPTLTQERDYEVTLVASDTAGNQQTDSFILTVLPVNSAPIARISANQIARYRSPNYPDNSYPVNSQILLDASASTDEDSPANLNPIKSYSWQQIAGPSLLAGVPTSQANLNLLAPALASTQEAVIRLTVTDQEDAIATADLTITLLAESETLPEVSMTPINNVFWGERTFLQAKASSLSHNARPFLYQWSAILPSNFAIQMDDTQSASTFAVLTTTDELESTSQDSTQLSYQITATDSFRNTATQTMTSVVFSPVVAKLNDTGVVQFASAGRLDGGNGFDYDFAGQDADFGADRQSLSEVKSKVGDGEQGFDFTGLDSNGNPVSDTQIPSCVRDNITGLIWQQKTNNQNTALSESTQLFSWYFEENTGGFNGNINADSDACNVANAQCNTQDYLEQVNAQGLCGFFDWRLPSPTELQSILHYGKVASVLVDEAYFPFLDLSLTGSVETAELWYWTSQPSADGISNDQAQNAWAIDFASGEDGFLPKAELARIILVRAGR